MENQILNMNPQEFNAALAELQLGAEREADLRRQYRRANSVFSPIYGLLDQIGSQDEAAGRVRGNVVPMTRPQGMTGLEAIMSGEADLAVPNTLMDLIGAVPMALDAPAAAYQGGIPAEDMVGEGLSAAGLLNLGSLSGTAPSGALRSGPMRVYHGGPEQITSPRATIDPEGLPEGFSVARTPEIARVYANMRGGNDGVVSEFEINPDQLRTIGEMDYYNFLDDLEARMGVDREDLTDAEIRNALLNEGYNAISYPDEDFGIRILDPSILRPVSQPTAQSGGGLLPPTFDEYLARVNPEGRSIPAEARPNLMMGDMYGMLPENAKRVGGNDGVQFYEADGDFYATAYNPDVGEMDVVGYAIRSGDMTDLQVVGEMQGSGIGSELQYLYRRANPDAPSGGLTEAGERSLRRTYNRLAQEGLLGKIGD